MAHFYDRGLDKVEANYQALSPLGFLERAARVYPQKTAIVHGRLRFTYDEFYGRCLRLASALKARGINEGDTVAIMAPNVPAMLDAHYAVPMIGAVLCPLNYRLDAAAIQFILEHGEAKVLLTDREFSDTIANALKPLKDKPLVIDIDDPEYEGDGALLGELDYEAFLAEGNEDFAWRPPADEWNAIALNYTSGTTGDPKGVVFHHRGAYLNAVNNVVTAGMSRNTVYLWTLPMFHCNGWCFTWSISVVAGTHICLRNMRPKDAFAAIAREKVTHMCGAPVVMNMLINATDEEKTPRDQIVEFITAAAPPPASVIQALESEGFHITHVYGLTETYGPVVECAWNSEWDELPLEERAQLKARQGVRTPALEELAVLDPETLEPVPADGKTQGEIMFRGNVVMKGYLKNPGTTEASFANGWFHSGDVAVLHEDGYIEIRDRSKDIIISGGENISSIEVEGVLFQHPEILEAAVVARPHEHWGETPCAFVTLKDQSKTVSEDEVIAFCRDRLAHFKAPKDVIFGDLPKTSTGKVQKFVLRERAEAL